MSLFCPDTEVLLMIGIRYVSDGPIGDALKHAYCSEMDQMRQEP
jgi:hypothetical protein